MRKLLLSALLCSSVSIAQAQPVTLDYSNYGSYAVGDSVTWDYAQTAIVPAEGVDKEWDYSYIMGLDFDNSDKPLQPNTGIFPSASYMREATYSISNYTVNGWVYFEKNGSGVYELGNQYIGATFYLQSGLGTLVIPDQTNSYAPKITEMQLPATYGSSWSTQTRLTFDAVLNIEVMGLNNAPIQLAQNHTHSDEVVGWGKVKMPGKTFYDVLLVKHTVVLVDSFYVAGAPADPTLLAGLGLVQSDTNRYTTYRFLSPGVKGSLIEFYREEGNTQWVASFRTGLATTSVTDKPAEKTISHLYPNPVVGNATLAFEKTSAAAWSVTLYNTPGQVVQSYRVDQPAGQARVELSIGSTVPAGSYRYEISNEYGVHVGNGMMVVVK